MADIRPEQLVHIFKNELDRKCCDCHGGGKLPVLSEDDCIICSGTGYQLTRAGVELVNFLRRQRKQIERD